MKTATSIQEVRGTVADWKQAGKRVGLVPTMGFLHEGHASLIRAAREACDKVVVSIFVNPTQFGPNEDLDSYPRDFERDSALCNELGVSMIFAPQPQEMYPKGYSVFVDVEYLGDTLCGKSRPGHFRGVCTVVSKLFNIIQPDMAFFGRKDAQQFAILSRMVRDLNIPVVMVSCPIVREADGLAKSSRNAYLNEKEHAAALVLHKALTAAQAMMQQGERDAQKIRQQMQSIIALEPLARLDYAEVVDAEQLNAIDKVTRPVLVALAVYLGKTRLIDNFSFAPEE